MEKGPLQLLRYLIGNLIGNLVNVARAGMNSTRMGLVGGALVGGILGLPAFPYGTIFGSVVGGAIGSTFNYARS